MKTYLNTTLKNVAWFLKAHNDGELDVKPPFQRNPVWVNKQKSYLIDTILKSYPIPEIYMQETVDNDGNSRHIIVDGQQRIRAVLEFIEGSFSMDANDSPEFADMRFDDLSNEQRQILYQYNFVIRMLPDIPDPQLREIFRRLNKNVVSLNAQELRHAAYWGGFITSMHKLSDLDSWREIDVFTPNDIRRMLDVEFISELAIAYLHGPQNKKDNLEKYYRFYEESFEDSQKTEKTFAAVVGELIKILPDIRKTRWSKKTDFYTLFLVFASHVEELPLSREKRVRCNELLLTFANDLDLYVRTEDEGQDRPFFSENVVTYGRGIRASTDLGSRKNRALGLENHLAEIWN